MLHLVRLLHSMFRPSHPCIQPFQVCHRPDEFRNRIWLSETADVSETTSSWILGRSTILDSDGNSERRPVARWLGDSLRLQVRRRRSVRRRPETMRHSRLVEQRSQRPPTARNSYLPGQADRQSAADWHWRGRWDSSPRQPDRVRLDVPASGRVVVPVVAVMRPRLRVEVVPWQTQIEIHCRGRIHRGVPEGLVIGPPHRCAGTAAQRPRRSKMVGVYLRRLCTNGGRNHASDQQTQVSGDHCSVTSPSRV